MADLPAIRYNRNVMKSLNEDIKNGQFKNIYLLYGEEDYLKKQYRDKLKQALLPADDTMNYAYYEGKNIPVTEVIDLSETMPFFAERRLIVIENSGLFKGQAAELSDYLKDVPDTTCFLFVEQEIDKRGKLFKIVKDKGRAVEFARQEERTLILWIAGRMKKEGKRVREATVRYLLSKTGTDMEMLSNELEKLFSYTAEADEVTPEDVDAICTTQITNRIFEMVDAVARGEKKKALDAYYDLLALKEPPMRILYLLTRQYRLLYEVKALTQRGMAKKQIAQELGIHPFVAGKCIDQSRAFAEGELRYLMEYGVELETDVKTGFLNDRMSVELFISSAGRE